MQKTELTDIHADMVAAVAYATADQVQAWKSPEPLQFDFVHPETGQRFRIEGIAQAKQRKAIYAEIRRLVPVAKELTPAVGYEPTPEDITDACWAAACVTIPAMTAVQWLRFGAEANLGVLLDESWIASRVIERRLPDAKQAEVPDGVEAAKAELKADPT